MFINRKSSSFVQKFHFVMVVSFSLVKKMDTGKIPVSIHFIGGEQRPSASNSLRSLLSYFPQLKLRKIRMGLSHPLRGFSSYFKPKIKTSPCWVMFLFLTESMGLRVCSRRSHTPSFTASFRRLGPLTTGKSTGLYRNPVFSMFTEGSPTPLSTSIKSPLLRQKCKYVKGANP